MFPTNENPVSDLGCTGIGSIAAAFAASLFDRPFFAAVFTILGAVALSIAMTCAGGDQ
jgi:hypothetical protein